MKRAHWAYDKPAPTIVTTRRAEGGGIVVGRRLPEGDGRNVGGWGYDRPATTLVGSFRPDIVAAPGYCGAGDGPRQNAEGGVRITLRDALILQSFPPEYPLQGSRTAQFLQVGNAVPPVLAVHILAEILGVDVPAIPWVDGDEAAA